MEIINLTMFFESSAGSEFKIKLNDVRPDLTKEEAETLGNMIVDKNMISYKGNSIVQYISSELEKIQKETL